MSDATPPRLAPGFWREKTLEEMSREEWEALCDGCGKCCMLKLEDIDTGRVHYTDVACRLFVDDTCRCGDYARRQELVEECLILTPELVRKELSWLPRTCAYRLVADGYDLYAWHPLVSGDPNSTKTAGMSMRGRTVSETELTEEEVIDRTLPYIV